ncbi:MAG: transcriptional regulator [Candidatus Sabulitectum sp.]|nr:transcriptional regulator [Candidatus Sabulitectum sp.]
MSKLEAAGCIDISREFVHKIPRTLLAITGKGHDSFQNYRRKMIALLQNCTD